MRSKVLVLLLLLVAPSAVRASTGRHHHHRAKSRHQLQSDLAQVRDRKTKLRAQLRQTRQQAHEVKEDLNSVDSKLENVKGRLSDTRSRLQAQKQEQAHVALQLAAANKELAETKQQVRRRLRVIYMQGQTSPFSALAGTRDAGELASRSFVMNAIERKDRELFNRYTLLKRETAEHKRRQDELVAMVASTAREEQSETRELATVRVEKGEVLQGLRVKQSDLQEELRQFVADEAEITSQIEAYARMHASRTGRGRQYPAFTGRFSRPVDGPITSGFGMRYHPILHVVRMHEGIDFGAPVGTPIHVVADGDVIATTFMRGYGHVVMVDHGGGVSTVYAHTSAVYCSPGQHVKRGQVIAAVGNSGLSTGPHLHFEVRINGHPVNPLSHL
jgi:murein DD-endopeptidase MepM/ murein hydrolase activator NlpD